VAVHRDSKGRFAKAPGAPKITVKPATKNKKIHAGRYVHDEAYDEDQHDMGPWIEVTSSRIVAIRYDYQNSAVQVTWPRSNTPYIYLDVPEERFRAFLRANSKGRFINSDLNNFEYRQATPDELDAPTNQARIA
jgi:hypothetical protein